MNIIRKTDKVIELRSKIDNTKLAEIVDGELCIMHKVKNHLVPNSKNRKNVSKIKIGEIQNFINNIGEVLS